MKAVYLSYFDLVWPELLLSCSFSNQYTHLRGLVRSNVILFCIQLTVMAYELDYIFIA